MNTVTLCPKCGHQRSTTDDPNIPEGQCPTCGIYYAKFINRQYAKHTIKQRPDIKPELPKASLCTHYDILKVAREASSNAIQAAYDALAEMYHPDKHPENRDGAEKVLKVINAAYLGLIDPVKRAKHDAWIRQEESSQLSNSHNRKLFDKQLFVIGVFSTVIIFLLYLEHPVYGLGVFLFACVYSLFDLMKHGQKVAEAKEAEAKENHDRKNLEQNILALQGFSGLEGAKKLYAQGRVDDAFLVGGSRITGITREQKILALQGFSGLEGAKELYTQGRVDDALLLFSTVGKFNCPPIIGCLPNNGLTLTADLRAECILMLQLLSFDNSDFLTLACRAFNSGFLIDSENKRLCFFTIKNNQTLETCYLLFKDVLGTFIVKNEKQILTTTKPNRFGNAILGGLLFGGEGAIVAASISSEQTTSTTQLDKLVFEIVLDCDDHPIHRMDCSENPGDIEFFQTLLELIMLDARLLKPKDSVDVKDHVRMIRLKLERERKA